MSKRYIHAYAISFSVETDDPTGAQVSPKLLRRALLNRIASFDDAKWLEAVEMPYYTYLFCEGDAR